MGFGHQPSHRTISTQTELEIMAQVNDISEQILEWILQNFPQAQLQKLGPDDSLLESGIIDSLGTLDVVLHLESEYGFEMEDDDMLADHFETVNSIANFVRSKI